MGEDGTTVVRLDLSDVSFGNDIPEDGFLTLYENGEWKITAEDGTLVEAGTYEAVPGWDFGVDTSKPLGAALSQAEGNAFDVFVANGVNPNLFPGGGAIWNGSGIGTAGAQAILGALISNETFNGLAGIALIFSIAA